MDHFYRIFTPKKLNWHIFEISEIDVGFEYGMNGKCAIAKHKYSAFARGRSAQPNGFGHRAIWGGGQKLRA